MIDDMIGGLLDTSFDGLIMLLQEHQLIASTFTPFFAGEYSIHLFGILNGSGDITLMPTIIATGSIIFFDILIYSTVRIVQKNKDVAGRMRKVKFFAKIEALFKKHQERYGKNPTLLLIAVKLMPMTKVTLIFFALYQKNVAAEIYHTGHTHQRCLGSNHIPTRLARWKRVIDRRSGATGKRIHHICPPPHSPDIPLRQQN